jgi:hypothetical protein
MYVLMYVFMYVFIYVYIYLSIYVCMTLFMYMYIYVCQSYIILTVKDKQKHLLLSYYILCVLYKNLSQFAIENDLVLSWYYCSMARWYGVYLPTY